MPNLTLVIGGASSGKSAFAERLVGRLGRQRIYVATAQALDSEMAAKIAAHRKRRTAEWRTIEAPGDLAGALGSVPPGHSVLVDCMTMWLSKRLTDGHPQPDDFGPELSALEGCASPVVVVSGEVGLGIVPDNALTRRFRDLQGRLNQAIAERSDLVVAVMAGLPQVLKGSLPEDDGW